MNPPTVSELRNFESTFASSTTGSVPCAYKNENVVRSPLMISRTGPGCVLIDYFGGVENPETDALDRLLEDGPPPAVAPIINQELLQGFPVARDFDRCRRWLAAFDHLDPPGYDDHRRAARLHLALRRKGFISSTADALIVTMAGVAARPLLTRDKLQLRLAEEAGVQIFRG